MASVDWNLIKKEYITTQIGYRDLAKKHGVAFRTLAHRAGKENWVELKERYNNEIVTKSVKNAGKKAVDYKNTLYELAFKVANQLVDMTEKFSLSDLAVMGLKPRDITGAIKDLEDALHIKSETDLKEQEARIAKLRKDASEDKQDNEIKVVIASGLEDYSK